MGKVGKGRLGGAKKKASEDALAESANTPRKPSSDELDGRQASIGHERRQGGPDLGVADAGDLEASSTTESSCEDASES